MWHTSLQYKCYHNCNKCVFTRYHRGHIMSATLSNNWENFETARYGWVLQSNISNFKHMTSFMAPLWHNIFYFFISIYKKNSHFYHAAGERQIFQGFQSIQHCERCSEYCIVMIRRNLWQPNALPIEKKNNLAPHWRMSVPHNEINEYKTR